MPSVKLWLKAVDCHTLLIAARAEADTQTSNAVQAVLPWQGRPLEAPAFTKQPGEDKAVGLPGGWPYCFPKVCSCQSLEADSSWRFSRDLVHTERHAKVSDESLSQLSQRLVEWPGGAAHFQQASSLTSTVLVLHQFFLCRAAERFRFVSAGGPSLMAPASWIRKSFQLPVDAF